jgi:photosystem II stability/assembly factor-like uncharacterized protein
MIILAGTGKGVYRLNADGAQQTLSSRGVRDLQCVADVVFAATGAGLFRSPDGGRHWDKAGLDEYEVWQVRATCDGQLMASTQPAGLFSSRDGGANWQPADSFNHSDQAASWCVPVDPPIPARARALVAKADDPHALCVGVEVGGIMRTDDGGGQWDLVLPGENPDLHMMFAHPAKPQVLFASTGYGRLDGVADMVEGNAGVFASEDFGATWAYRWRGVEPRYSRPMCIDSRAPYALTVAAAPHAFSSYKQEGGARAMLFRSEDEGHAWRSLCDPAHSPSRVNFHGLTADPEVPGGVIVGTDNGEIWRVDNEANWTEVITELPAVLSLAVA